MAALHESTLQESRGGADLGEYISRAAGGKKFHAFWLSMDGVLFYDATPRFFRRPPSTSLVISQ
jgi:hypothetical protein